jgi:hypothetical protein
LPVPLEAFPGSLRYFFVQCPNPEDGRPEVTTTWYRP